MKFSMLCIFWLIKLVSESCIAKTNNIPEPFYCENCTTNVNSDYNDDINLLNFNFTRICLSDSVVDNVRTLELDHNSTVISWNPCSYSKIKGFLIAYHVLIEKDIVIRTPPLPSFPTFHLLSDLKPETTYLICVFAYWDNETEHFINSILFSSYPVHSWVRDSPWSKCEKISTPAYAEKLTRQIIVHHRRISLAIGALLAFIVFAIFMTTIASIKLRQRNHIMQHLQDQEEFKVEYNITDSVLPINIVGIGTLGEIAHSNSMGQPKQQPIIPKIIKTTEESIPMFDESLYCTPGESLTVRKKLKKGSSLTVPDDY